MKQELRRQYVNSILSLTHISLTHLSDDAKKMEQNAVLLGHSIK